MAFKKRSDGIYLGDLPPFKKLFPYVMEGRNISAIYSVQRVDATRLLAFLEKANEGRTKENKIGLFHVILAVIARTFHLRPDLNRFIAGRRFYQHKDISISFLAKKEYTEEAPEVDVGMVFTGTETLEEIRERLQKRLGAARSDSKSDDDKLIYLVGRMPRFLMDLIPFYTSIYMANLGSIGLGASFHHLFELGTARAFLTIGKISKQPVVDDEGRVVARDMLEFAFVFDERVSEGFNHIRSIKVFEALLTNPELLVEGETDIDRIIAVGEGRPARVREEDAKWTSPG